RRQGGRCPRHRRPRRRPLARRPGGRQPPTAGQRRPARQVRGPARRWRDLRRSRRAHRTCARLPGRAGSQRRRRRHRRARRNPGGMPVPADARRGRGAMSAPMVIITGVSGSGKSTALHALEDIGFYTVDNLPPSLWPELITLVSEHESKGLAIGIDIRAREYLAQAPSVIAQLEELGHDPVVLFLDASDETLVRRYNFTRRTHPISQGTLTADLAAERQALEPLRAIADEVLDTTLTSARALTQSLWDRFTDGDEFLLRLISFGYKRGIPTDVDAV